MCLQSRSSKAIHSYDKSWLGLTSGQSGVYIVVVVLRDQYETFGISLETFMLIMPEFQTLLKIDPWTTVAGQMLTEGKCQGAWKTWLRRSLQYLGERHLRQRLLAVNLSDYLFERLTIRGNAISHEPCWGRGQILPLPDCLDNSKTTGDIDANFYYFMRHQFKIFHKIFGKICRFLFESDVVVTSFLPFLVKNAK